MAIDTSTLWDSREFVPYKVYVHLDVADEIENHSDLKRRCNMRLRDMAARGSLTKVKGVSGNVNRGWLRTPLGGNGGNQFYLYFTRTGLPAAPVSLQGDAFRDAFWVRAVRHHDNHDPLEFGNPDLDYYPFTPEEIKDDNLFTEQPWTDDQYRCVAEAGKVNLLYGSPGSGKTTSLLKVVEDSPGEKILFTTWSRELTNLARKYTATLASPSSRVLLHDFHGLLSLLAQHDFQRIGFVESRRMFEDLLNNTVLRPNDLGPWRNRSEAIFAETRAVLIGRASPGVPGTQDIEGGLVRLRDKEYLDVRGNSSGVGYDAARSLLRFIRPLCGTDDLSGIFPELRASVLAIKKLRSGDVPQELLDVDKILVDEIQDLSLLEFTSLVELVLAIKKQTHQMPAVYLAGDEGQTVLPSGFNWNWTKRLLYEKVGRPQEFEHVQHLRTARRISHVITKSSELYRSVERGERPSGQKRDILTTELLGNVFHLQVQTSSEASDILRQIVQDPLVRVVSPTDDLPDWLGEDLRNLIWTPSMVKGLEFEKVLVLDPGRILNRVGINPDAQSDLTGLNGHINRTIIDNLRVVISRATDTLVFLDVSPDEKMSRLSKELLGDSAVETQSDILLDEIMSDDITPENTIRAYLEDASAISLVDRVAAWKRLEQCAYLCDESYSNLLVDIHNALYNAAITFLIESVPEGLSRESMVQKASLLISDTGDSRYTALLNAAQDWEADKDLSPLCLLKAACDLPGDDAWLKLTLSSVKNTLVNGLHSAAASEDMVGEFFEDVSPMLSLFLDAEQTKSESDDLRLRGAHTLFKSGKHTLSRKMLDMLPTDLVEKAALDTVEHNVFGSSVFLYEYLGLFDTAGKVRETAAFRLMADVPRYFEAGEFHNIVQTCDEALAYVPDNIEIIEIRARSNRKMKRLAEAVKDCDRMLKILEDDERRVGILSLKSECLRLSGGSRKRVLKCFDEMLAIAPQNTSLWLERVSYYRDDLKDLKAAKKASMDFIEKFQNHPEGYIELASLHRLERQYEDGLGVINQGIMKTRDDVNLLSMRGSFLTDLQRYGDAVETLSIVCRMYSDEPLPYLCLGRAFALDGKTENAVQAYSKAHELNPLDVMASYYLGLSLFQAYTRTYDRYYLDRCISVLTAGIDEAVDDQDDIYRLHDMRALAYEQRGQKGDIRRRNADFSEVNKVFPGSYDLKSIESLDWDFRDLNNFFLPPI